jgi:adenylate cyclase
VDNRCIGCPACGHEQSGGKFCSECGASLPGTREPEGERKQLTVLFADVQGSMELQEELDAEVWAGIMGRLLPLAGGGHAKRLETELCIGR